MTPMFVDDRTLIQEFKKGNKLAFSYIYLAHYENLCKYIYGYTKNSHKAEDIVQTTMVTIWDHREKLNENKSLKSYIYKVAFNQFVNVYRKEIEYSKYIVEVKKTALSYFVDEKDDIINSKSKIVSEAIESLPPKCKEAFLLNKKHGLKYKEVAEELNISVKTVEIHISKGMNRLKDKLKNSRSKNMYFLLFGRE